MLTVSEVADHYGVSTGFLVQALAKVGCPGMKPDSVLSAATIARIEKAFGDKIRAARPASPTADPAPARAPIPRKSKPHVMRVAHAKITGKRDPHSCIRYKDLLDDPGIVHAIDAAGTQEGDPWDGREAPSVVHFFEGAGPYAACGTTKVRAVLGDRFDPDDPDRVLCPRCAELVADNKGFRDPPHERPSTFCEDYLRLKVDGRVIVEECRLRDFHSGPHRTLDGATWYRGAEDYKPATSN